MDAHANLVNDILTGSVDFDAALLAFKPEIDKYLSSILNKRVSSSNTVGERYEKLWLDIHNVVLSGGKRIRPFLTATGYGKIDTKILPVAAAQEFIHVAMLMHDDVIDQDIIRHGAKNINGIYKEEYADYLDEKLGIHFSNSAGMLAGDLLISEAYNQLNNSAFEPQIILALHNQLSKAIFEVVGGELLDVEATILKDMHFDPISIYRHKTASYSFICPLLLGAICAGLDTAEMEALTEFGALIGVAYQIQDDIIGVFGDEIKTGKSTLGDLREGKQTLLINIHKKRIGKTQEQNLRFLGSPNATDSELKELKKDIESSGAKAETEQILQEYFKKADAALDKLSDGFRISTLRKLSTILQTREA